MKLKAKLAQLRVRGLNDSATSLPTAQQTPVVIEREREASRAIQLRARLDALRRAKAPSQASVQPSNGWLKQVVPTSAGALCQIITWHAPTFCQGITPLAPCLRVQGAQLSALALDLALQNVDARRLLFIDTETTGLAGGAGTLPFLIGVGYFVEDALCIEQWMLRRPGQEVPMLERLAQCLQAADAIVTYNGKSFDWPLLRNRFILNRVAMPDPRPHLDLLHCTRRLLKKRGPQAVGTARPSLRLSAVERDILGFARVDDIDGAHIPERYFSFLRGGSPALLDPVIEHNRHDLVSLAALLGYAAHRLDDVELMASADEHLNLAHLAWRGKHTERAAAFAQRARESSCSHVRVQAALLLGQMLIRQRKFVQASVVLEDGLVSNGSHPQLQATLHLILAKLYEHRLSDASRAIVHAVGTQKAEGTSAMGKRIARLERKLMRIKVRDAAICQRVDQTARAVFAQVNAL